MRCIHHDTRCDQQQQQTQNHGRDGLEAGVTIGVFLVRLVTGEANNHQNHGIAGQIREGVDTVGEQRLGLADDAEQKLEAPEQQVESGADQSHSLFNPVLVLKRRLHAAHSLYYHEISKPVPPTGFQPRVILREAVCKQRNDPDRQLPRTFQ